MSEGIIVTGGAGFVGANLALGLRAAFPARPIVVFDNLRRRGSELNLPRLRAAAIDFIHGDIRNTEDLERLPAAELMIDASAEPSVYAAEGHGPRELLQINLAGTLNLLEWARRRQTRFLFLSTSRVYPIARLNALPYSETATRYEWTAEALGPGVTAAGITADFPLGGARSFYGAAKLASELLIQEYVHSHQLPALINRCGILAGPWQFGKVDQGVCTLWVASHLLEQPLKYLGFGGTGLQVRDLLHIDDFRDLVLRQIARPEVWDGRVYNVGGGPANAVSLLELTTLCHQTTGRVIPLGSHPETHPLDIRLFITDARVAQADFGWRVTRDVPRIVADIHGWLLSNEAARAAFLAS